MTDTDHWMIDIHIAGRWKPSGATGWERSLNAARQRADAVHHWCACRVRNARTGEVWQRAAGTGWHRGESVIASANPRTPLRTGPHAVDPVQGVPEEQLQWWQK